MSTAALNYYTPEEYLALERRAGFRSEYIDGRIVAMAGTPAPHNFIAGRIYAHLLSCIPDECRAYFSEIKVRIAPGTRYTYPDVAVACSPEYGDSVLDTLLNPVLIVEVLSPSTEVYDRTEKFAAYRRIATLREYVLVSQERVLVECFRREGDLWRFAAVDDLSASLELESVPCSLPLRDIYRDVDPGAPSGPPSGG
ncbi:MAG TPA: Uma2 family endonuclease [Longimicrobium sp.]|nr:Uma2 family endonuclease [Longimicrobium sp.]